MLARSSHQLLPDFAAVHQELKRAGVTLQLLWEEYAQDNALAYKYTSFCVKYRAWVLGLKRSIRQIHIAGEKLFVDYAGQTVALIDAATGEITRAQIFVATFGASNYTLAKPDSIICRATRVISLPSMDEPRRSHSSSNPSMNATRDAA